MTVLYFLFDWSTFVQWDFYRPESAWCSSYHPTLLGETKKINMDWIKSNKSSLRHAGHMPHDHIKRLDGIHGYLLTPAFQSFFQCIEADLSYKLDSHTEHPVTAFTRQCHLQLNLTTYQSINFSRSLELYFYKSLQWQRHCITSKRNTCWRAHKG